MPRNCSFKKNLSITNIFLVIFLAGMHSTATYKVLIDEIELFNKFLHDITQDERAMTDKEHVALFKHFCDIIQVYSNLKE